MRLLVFIAILFASCQPKQDYKKEYDNILMEQSEVEKQIDTSKIIVADNKRFGLPDSIAIWYIKRLDSLTIIKSKLDKRRNELAEKLYK